MAEIETEIKEAVVRSLSPHAKNQLAMHETAELIETSHRYLNASKEVIDRALTQLTELRARYARDSAEIERRMKTKLEA